MIGIGLDVHAANDATIRS